MGSMLLEPRSRRGERFIGLCAVRAAHSVGKIVPRRENRLSDAPNAANASKSVAHRLLWSGLPSPPPWWIPPRAVTAWAK